VSPETKELGHEQMLMELQDSGIEPLHRHFQIKCRIMSQELCLVTYAQLKLILQQHMNAYLLDMHTILIET
jgi:hypothetical protein